MVCYHSKDFNYLMIKYEFHKQQLKMSPGKISLGKLWKRFFDCCWELTKLENTCKLFFLCVSTFSTLFVWRYNPSASFCGCLLTNQKLLNFQCTKVSFLIIFRRHSKQGKIDWEAMNVFWIHDCPSYGIKRGKIQYGRDQFNIEKVLRHFFSSVHELKLKLSSFIKLKFRKMLPIWQICNMTTTFSGTRPLQLGF